MKTFSATTLVAAFSVILLIVSFSHSMEYENLGMTRGHLDTLYNLRNKLGGLSTASSINPPSFSTPIRKESRGYSFHYLPSGVTHPSYNSASFSSRAGKVDGNDSPINSNKLKSSNSKSWNKYSKLAYKTYPIGSSVNSFNVHQKIGQDSVTDIVINTTQPTTTATTTTTTFNPMIDLSQGPIQSLSQSLNNVMTTVLTQRLMNLLDQDVPEGIFTPLRHIVATGNRMVEFWDKRANARDGKKPGIVEMFGYGLNQLKKFRDGQSVKSSDPVANLTSPSKTLIQGMITVKKLTNRVLGYDTTGELVESRGGGYGHDSYGHGGGHGQYMSYGGHGMGGLDPFSLLAALAFGAFLLQLLLTLLNTSARSLNVVDLNTPLALSDFHLPNFKTTADNFFGTPTVRNKRDTGGFDSEDNLFDSVVDKLDGMYKTFIQISEKPNCARLHMCRLTLDEVYGDRNSILSPLYIYGLGHWTNDKSSIDFVESIKNRVAKGEEVDCDKIVKDCSQKEINNFI